ncbi:ABC transporter permease subunit [Bacillus canaveralius]|uniref:ABC transporter permease subunit n=1 Tax=Bacillus canaveralius TaxID=1403243 RepID=UPI000F78BB3F|nr:ABC transporter permease subunit [Bacillus canaveralius]RSK54700.1 ABC transporter [Bacillus canaveralius]
MNIFLREMKAIRKSLLIWCSGVVFMIGAGMGKYAGLASTGDSMNELMASMPKSLQAIMGTGSLDLSKVIGYYGMLYLYLAVMATIHACMLGANMISKEERDKTAEFLLVKPISRGRIITYKLLAAFVNIIIFNLITLISSLVMVHKYADGEEVIGDIMIMMLGMFFLQLIFLAIGTAIAAINNNPKSPTSISTGILLVTFILSIAIDLNGKLEKLSYFTPFKYFDAKNLISEGIENSFVLLSVVQIIGLIIATYVFYKKRDINV